MFMSIITRFSTQIMCLLMIKGKEWYADLSDVCVAGVTEFRYANYILLSWEMGLKRSDYQHVMIISMKLSGWMGTGLKRNKFVSFWS